jgi:hypothetical protein
MFPTALPPNLLAVEIARKVAHVDMSWAAWAMAFLPVGDLVASVPSTRHRDGIRYQHCIGKCQRHEIRAQKNLPNGMGPHQSDAQAEHAQSCASHHGEAVLRKDELRPQKGKFDRDEFADANHAGVPV